MKKSLIFVASAMFFAACNSGTPASTPEQKSGQVNKDEIRQATGTVIGSYGNGFASLLIQVDETYPIGKTIEPVDYERLYTDLPENVTYRNVIQVQYNLPVETGNKISFSYRIYLAEKDFESLFAINGGMGHEFGEQKPDVPIFVITEYKTINN